MEIYPITFYRPMDMFSRLDAYVWILVSFLCAFSDPMLLSKRFTKSILSVMEVSDNIWIQSCDSFDG